MNPTAYQIRTMSYAEISFALHWADQEGWNPGISDHQSFYAADEQGFWVGLLNYEPIACISAVKYGSDFGFIGFYIVKPPYRGQGYGLKIWQTALESLNGRTIGLDGVVSQQANYQKFGFQRAYANMRYQGVTGSIPKTQPQPLNIQDCSLDKLIEFDRIRFGYERAGFLSAWLNQPSSRAFAYTTEQGDILAYGLIRPCQVGYKIGPLFAQTEAQAEGLLHALQASVPAGRPFFLDIPVINPQAVALVQRYSMQPVFETARMYKGSPPSIPIEQVYGVTSFELG
jgi:predicted N-acetyltransferase YhbS